MFCWNVKIQTPENEQMSPEKWPISKGMASPCHLQPFIYQHPHTGALWTPLLETTPCTLQARSEKNMKHHGAWPWNTTCTLRDTQKVRYASFRACQCVSFTCQSFPPLANVSVNGCPLGTPSDVCRGKGAYWAPHSKGVGPNTTARNVSFPCRFHPNLDLLQMPHSLGSWS